MKKIVLIAIFFFLGFGLIEELADAYIFPPTVSQLDVPRYMGKWYEVQSTKPFFQKGCVCNTAEYKLLADGTVAVENSCRVESPTGPIRTVEALAKTTSEPGKLRVDFGGIRLPIANYWVIDLAPDYSYAVVSTLLRNPVWILSRTPSLNDETMMSIKDKLKGYGFDTSKLSDTEQTSCL